MNDDETQETRSLWTHNLFVRGVKTTGFTVPNDRKRCPHCGRRSTVRKRITFGGEWVAWRGCLACWEQAEKNLGPVVFAYFRSLNAAKDETPHGGNCVEPI